MPKLHESSEQAGPNLTSHSLGAAPQKIQRAYNARSFKEFVICFKRKFYVKWYSFQGSEKKPHADLDVVVV